MTNTTVDHAREAAVVGGIGHFETGVVRRMSSLLPEPGHLMSEDGLMVQYGGRLRSWEFGSARGWTWASLDRSVRPTSVESARDEAGAIGIAISHDQIITVHGDHIGVWPFYYTRRGDAMYFSNRLEPVLSIVERPTLDRLA